MSTDLATTDDQAVEPGTDLEIVEPDEIIDDTTVNDRLFDRNAYANPKLIVETEDGQRVDELVLKINGAIVLQRDSEAACDLYRALKQGRMVRLEINGHVIGDGHDLKTKADDEITVGTRKIRVTRIETARLAGEEHVL